MNFKWYSCFIKKINNYYVLLFIYTNITILYIYTNITYYLSGFYSKYFFSKYFWKENKFELK